MSIELDMIIMIPTYKRVGKQFTWDLLPAELQEYTLIVCPEDEVPKHVDTGIPEDNLLAQPDHISTISEKRAWMFRWAYEVGELDKAFMMDDDLSIEGRTPDGRLLRSGATDDVLIEEFWRMADWLSPPIPQVGISHRPQNIHVEDTFADVGRCMYAFGFYLPVALKVIEFGRVSRREDMDYTLQLLLAGYKNRINYQICVSDRGYDNDDGGCSDERTLEESNREAERLAEMYPGLVRVVERDYNTSQPRKEVVVSWKKAYDTRALPMDLFRNRRANG